MSAEPLALFGPPKGWLTDLYRKKLAVMMTLNWPIWCAFEWEADRIWARGFRHWSARTIGEYLRHETALREGNADGWKLNNNILPDLSRLYSLMHPDRVGFFEERLNPLSVRSA